MKALSADICMVCGDPSTVVDDPFTFCDRCEAGLIASFSTSGIALEFPSIAVAPVPSSAPSQGGTGATFLDPTSACPVSSLTSVLSAGASVSALFSFEAEASALEAEWARDGILMNATTFLVSVNSDKSSKSAMGA